MYIYMRMYVHIHAENQEHQMVMNSFPAPCSMYIIGYNHQLLSISIPEKITFCI